MYDTVAVGFGTPTEQDVKLADVTEQPEGGLLRSEHRVVGGGLVGGVVAGGT